MKTTPNISMKNAALIASLVTLPAISGFALTYTGNGDGTTWDSAANWDGTTYVGDGIETPVGDPPVNVKLGNADAYFVGVNGGDRTVNLSSSLDDVSAGGNTVRIDGGQGASNTTVNILSGGVYNATLNNSLLTINEGGPNSTDNTATLNINGGSFSIGQIRMGRDSDGGTSKISISNGTMTMTGGGEFEMRTDAGLNSTGIFEMTGGTFNATANRNLFLGAGDSQVLLSGNSVFNATGLTYQADGKNGINADGATTLFQIAGSGVDADLRAVNGFINSGNTTGSSTFHFISDAAGFSTVDVANLIDLVGDGSQPDAKLIVDLSLYEGVATEFDLMTFGTVAGTFTDITVIGATLDAMSYTDNKITIGVAVPEPSSYALLAGLVGLTSVMVRRRK